MVGGVLGLGLVRVVAPGRRQQRQVQGRGDVPTTLLTDVEVTDAAGVDGQVLVGGCSGRTGDRLEHRTGGLVLATGYRGTPAGARVPDEV